MASENPVRVGVYARISEDRDGQQTATARQMQDAQQHAERKGWEIVDVFEDVDISAFSTKVKRPEFERMLIALRDGAIDGVVVWKLDRLTRQQRDFARVMEACEVNKGFISSCMEPIDTRESYGQFIGELLVAQARMESANTSARQRRKAQEQRGRDSRRPTANGASDTTSDTRRSSKKKRQSSVRCGIGSSPARHQLRPGIAWDSFHGREFHAVPQPEEDARHAFVTETMELPEQCTEGHLKEQTDEFAAVPAEV